MGWMPWHKNFKPPAGLSLALGAIHPALGKAFKKLSALRAKYADPVAAVYAARGKRGKLKSALALAIRGAADKVQKKQAQGEKLGQKLAEKQRVMREARAIFLKGRFKSV